MSQEQIQTSPLERRIDMSVAIAEVDQMRDQRLKVHAKKAKMPGFRPGKVPMKVVAQQYGYQAHNEAINFLVEKAWATLVKEQSLKVAGYPRFEPRKTEGNEAESTTIDFTAVFEIFPEITLADLTTTEVEKLALAVTDVEVDRTIEVLRKQRQTFAESDGAAEKDDRITIDFAGSVDGVAFDGGTAQDFPVAVGGGQMLPDFDAGLVGLKVGESKTIDVAFPESYGAENLAGKTAQFVLTGKKLEKPVLPEVDADFAIALGIADGDVAKLREEVKANLEREVAKRIHAKVKNQVMDAVLAANPIDVPQSLVAYEAEAMAEQAKKDFAGRGMPAGMNVETSWFTEGASRRVKLGLLLAEIVSKQEIRATAEQVRKVIEEFSATFEDPQQVARWYYSQPERMQEAESLATENNVVEWVLSVAKVTEKAVDFDELMGNAA